VGIILERQEAITVLKELLDKNPGLDGHGLELTAPTEPTFGYQIIIKGTLDDDAKQHVQNVLLKNQLTSQTGNLWKTKPSLNKTEPDTLIIYKAKKRIC
jgi:hypothetical protein